MARTLSITVRGSHEAGSSTTDVPLATALQPSVAADPQPSIVIDLQPTTAPDMEDTNHRSLRHRQPSSRLRDYVCHTTRTIDSPSLSSDSSPSLAITAGSEPSHFLEVVCHSVIDVMDNEVPDYLVLLVPEPHLDSFVGHCLPQEWLSWDHFYYCFLLC